MGKQFEYMQRYEKGPSRMFGRGHESGRDADFFGDRRGDRCDDGINSDCVSKLLVRSHKVLVMSITVLGRHGR